MFPYNAGCEGEIVKSFSKIVFEPFCIVNFVILLTLSYKCNLHIGTAVPIPTLEVL